MSVRKILTLRSLINFPLAVPPVGDWDDSDPTFFVTPYSLIALVKVELFALSIALSQH